MLTKNQNSRLVSLEDDLQVQIEEYKFYESAQIDHLLKTSYVQLDDIRQRVSFEQDNAEFNSGETFFQKTNQMFHQQFPKKQYKRMKNKKTQFNIGSGTEYESTKSSVMVREKMRRLQILKMIKLVRLIFKHVRSFKEKIRTDLTELIAEHKTSFDSIVEEMNRMSSKFCKEIDVKDIRIIELESQLQEKFRMNSWLSHKLSQNHQASERMVEDIQLQKNKSLAQIKDALMTASLKGQEIQEQNEQLQHQNQCLQQQIQNLQYLCNNYQIQIKKLEYQNEKLEKQSTSLSLRVEQLSKQGQQRQFHCNQLNNQCLLSNEQVTKLMKLNELYQRQLDSIKQQMLKLEQMNVQVTKQAEQIIISQLNRYQECFNQQIVKIKNEHQSQIMQKNAIIQHLKEKEEKLPHAKTINQNKMAKSNKIFKLIDSNNNLFKGQVEKQNTQSRSDCSIPHLLIHNNAINHNSRLNIKKCIEKVDQQQLHKNKVKSIGYLPKKSEIKCQNREPDIVFKAKEHTVQLKVKLADYLRQKEFASDGMLKAYIKLNKNKANQTSNKINNQ